MFWISNGFLIPVIIGLLYFFVESILLLGGFVSRYVKRSRVEKEIKARLDGMDEGNVAGLKFPDGLPKSRLVCCLEQITASDYNEAVVNKTVSEYELSCGKELDQAKILIRLGNKGFHFLLFRVSGNECVNYSLREKYSPDTALGFRPFQDERCFRFTLFPFGKG